MSASVKIGIEAGVRLKTHSKHKFGGKKVLLEIHDGDDFFRKAKAWSTMKRTIDRVNDWYEEEFRDQKSGKVIHKTSEPLSEHRHDRNSKHK